MVTVDGFLKQKSNEREKEREQFHALWFCKTGVYMSGTSFNPPPSNHTSLLKTLMFRIETVCGLVLRKNVTQESDKDLMEKEKNGTGKHEASSNSRHSALPFFPN